MKVVDIILERVIKGLKEGRSWVKTWASGIPTNGATKHEYSGINKLLLCNYEIPRFYSFKQVQDMRESVKSGAKAIPVVFWKLFEDDSIDEEFGVHTGSRKRQVPLMRYYNVFNEADTTIKPLPVSIVTGDPVCETIVENYVDKPPIEFGEPAYSHVLDKVYMPKISDFSTTQKYYATLFHEFSHSTGHESRLNRNLKNNYGSNDYALEELTAELSTCFLTAKAGIENKVADNSQAYINSWISRFQEKPSLIISLASQAEKAYKYILKEELSQ